MITTNYLNSLANYTLNDVAKVKVNNSIIVTDFSLRQVTDNICEISYVVNKSQTSLITNIKLLKSDNTVILDDNVNLSVDTDSISIRHKLTITEVI